MESLSLGVGRLVEIGRALMIRPRLLLLDEPSSGLDRTETAKLAETLRVVQREAGDRDPARGARRGARAPARRAVVLDFGTLIASGPTDSVFADTAVRKAYLGDVV